SITPYSPLLSSPLRDATTQQRRRRGEGERSRRKEEKFSLSLSLSHPSKPNPFVRRGQHERLRPSQSNRFPHLLRWRRCAPLSHPSKPNPMVPPVD
uniref:Uncharacterized protein n=1 Tax=Oryza brachyantha TaxID=4533 RepID=J3L6A2_ORYBR